MTFPHCNLPFGAARSPRSPSTIAESGNRPTASTGRRACRGVSAILSATLLLLSVAGASAEQGTHPATVFTETRTTLVFDGQTHHDIEGTVRWDRRPAYDAQHRLMIFGEVKPSIYVSNPNRLASSLPDGSVLSVGGVGVQLLWSAPPALMPHEIRARRDFLPQTPRPGELVAPESAKQCVGRRPSATSS